MRKFDKIAQGPLKYPFGPIIGVPDDDFDVRETASTGIAPVTGKQLIPAASTPNPTGLRHLYQVGGYFGMFEKNPVSSGMTVGSELVTPLQITEDINIDQLAINVVSSSGTAVTRLGLYKNVTTVGTYYPGALLVDGGAVDVTANGIRTVSVAVELTPGIYWMVIKTTTASASLRSYDNTSGSASPELMLGFDNTVAAATAFAQMFQGFRRTGLAAGAFTDPYPAGIALTPVATGVPFPIMAVRVSAVNA